MIIMIIIIIICGERSTPTMRSAWPADGVAGRRFQATRPSPCPSVRPPIQPIPTSLSTRRHCRKWLSHGETHPFLLFFSFSLSSSFSPLPLPAPSSNAAYIVAAGSPLAAARGQTRMNQSTNEFSQAHSLHRS